MRRAAYLRDRLSIDEEAALPAQGAFKTCSARELPFDAGKFDAALTSPPYATRIDYVKGTIPELGVLGADTDYLERLRRRTTGSPVVKGRELAGVDLGSECGTRTLERIRRHPTKGSSGYYYPWMLHYLLGLQDGLRETARTVRTAGTICIVVQDSYYKESRIDLQRIVIEMMGSLGRDLLDRRDFDASNLRSRMNPRARAHAPRRRNTESLMVFG